MTPIPRIVHKICVIIAFLCVLLCVCILCSEHIFIECFFLSYLYFALELSRMDKSKNEIAKNSRLLGSLWFFTMMVWREKKYVRCRMNSIITRYYLRARVTLLSYMDLLPYNSNEWLAGFGHCYICFLSMLLVLPCLQFT